MKKINRKIWKHKNLEKYKTKDESIVYKLFNDLDLYPIWQYQVGRYIADFVFKNEKVIVELDGSFHNIPDNMTIRNAVEIRDKVKDYAYKMSKYTVIRIKYNKRKLEGKELDNIKKKIINIKCVIEIIRKKQYINGRITTKEIEEICICYKL